MPTFAADVGVGGTRVVLQRGDDVEVSRVQHVPHHRTPPLPPCLRQPTCRGMAPGDDERNRRPIAPLDGPR